MQLDHVAMAGETLEEAVDAIETALGVPMQPGGRHERFGTHNRLLGLDEGFYIEAIAVDPSAPKPKGARWFDLDRFSGRPRLTNWVCRSADMGEVLCHLPLAGVPVPVSRGNLNWMMAVPLDGRLPYDNLHPALIQWNGPHPGAVLTQSGCRLRRLIVSHPEAMTLRQMLRPVFEDSRVIYEQGPPELVAEFDTPDGPRILH